MKVNSIQTLPFRGTYSINLKESDKADSQNVNNDVVKGMTLAYLVNISKNGETAQKVIEENPNLEKIELTFYTQDDAQAEQSMKEVGLKFNKIG